MLTLKVSVPLSVVMITDGASWSWFAGSEVVYSESTNSVYPYPVTVQRSKVYHYVVTFDSNEFTVQLFAGGAYPLQLVSGLVTSIVVSSLGMYDSIYVKWQLNNKMSVALESHTPVDRG